MGTTCSTSETPVEEKLLRTTVVRRKCLGAKRAGEWTRWVSAIVDYWLRTECDALQMPTVAMRIVYKFVAMLIDSKIISNEEFDDLYKRAAAECRVSLAHCHLLLRATDDGFDFRTFHRLCDGKCPTLTIFHTEFGHVIGGFTTLKWATSGGAQRDRNAWMFVCRVKDSLKEKREHCPYIFKASSFLMRAQVTHGYTHGPTFGNLKAEGTDLTLWSYRCDSSVSNPFYLHWPTHEVTGGSPLPGHASLFHVVDYEVFSVNRGGKTPQKQWVYK